MFPSFFNFPNYNKNKEPWTSARWLYKFRNQIAHPKPEPISIKAEMSQTEYDNRGGEYPKSKLEKEITYENACRALNTVEKIKELLCDKIPVGKAQGLDVDGSYGFASKLDDV